MDTKPQLSIVPAINPFDHESMLLAAIEEYSGTPDAVVDGRRISLHDISKIFKIGLRSGRLDLFCLFHGTTIAGLIVIDSLSGWLSGHLFYLLPEFRGRHFAEAHIPLMVGLARSRGLRGFRVVSTSSQWPGLETVPEPFTVQADGTSVYEHFRRAA